MKLSEIKGERSLDVIADVMEFVDKVGDDERFKQFLEAYKEANGDSDAVRRAFCTKLPPLIRDYKDDLIAVLASASGVPKEEYAESGNVIGDVMELLLSDTETLGFLGGTPLAEA